MSTEQATQNTDARLGIGPTMGDVIDAHPDGVFMPLFTLDRYTQREYRAYAKGAKILNSCVVIAERTVGMMHDDSRQIILCIELARDKSSHTSVNIWPPRQ